MPAVRPEGRKLNENTNARTAIAVTPPHVEPRMHDSLGRVPWLAERVKLLWLGQAWAGCQQCRLWSASGACGHGHYAAESREEDMQRAPTARPPTVKKPMRNVPTKTRPRSITALTNETPPQIGAIYLQVLNPFGVLYISEVLLSRWARGSNERTGNKQMLPDAVNGYNCSRTCASAALAVGIAKRAAGIGSVAHQEHGRSWCRKRVPSRNGPVARSVNQEPRNERKR
ncbi:hypothetical protein FB45DRAFT_862319 [Roridomyces roridus]|uniref:Uncharacterized protein n=1 Tax=Roridomyces roridus TaxID=1738132 RepID=A0AAD7C735_9AGAR|nr:hypothetical protein FB45DRAFT_862319 [Roridomyces roridus]